MRHLAPLFLAVSGRHVPLVRGRLVLHVRRAKVGVEDPTGDALPLDVVVGEVVVTLRRYLEDVPAHGARGGGGVHGEARCVFLFARTVLIGSGLRALVQACVPCVFTAKCSRLEQVVCSNGAIFFFLPSVLDFCATGEVSLPEDTRGASCP